MTKITAPLLAVFGKSVLPPMEIWGYPPAEVTEMTDYNVL
jgi:hypothetical protein